MRSISQYYPPDKSIQMYYLLFPLSEFLELPKHDPPLLPLRELRQIRPPRRPTTVEKVDPETGTKTTISSWDRFQPNDPAVSD